MNIQFSSNNEKNINYIGEVEYKTGSQKPSGQLGK